MIFSTRPVDWDVDDRGVKRGIVEMKKVPRLPMQAMYIAQCVYERVYEQVFDRTKGKFKIVKDRYQNKAGKVLSYDQFKVWLDKSRKLYDEHRARVLLARCEHIMMEQKEADAAAAEISQRFDRAVTELKAVIKRVKGRG